MESLILRNYETFDEIPHANLMVKENSNLMYVRIGKSAFIAREFIDCIEHKDEIIVYNISYYSVENNEKILSLNIEKSAFDGDVLVTNKRCDMDIIPLSKVLNIKGSAVTFISSDDVNDIINFKKEYVEGKKISII